MGLREWADRQVRKKDLMGTIQETHFQIRFWEGLKATLQVTEYDKASVSRFDDTLSEYINSLISGLRQSEARLWRFKGNSNEWEGSEKMIAAGRLRWDEGEREHLILADVYLNELRTRLTGILREFEASKLTAAEVRGSLESEIGSFHDKCLNHCTQLENEAISGGLANQDTIDKHKKLAEKRVGVIFGKALS